MQPRHWAVTRPGCAGREKLKCVINKQSKSSLKAPVASLSLGDCLPEMSGFEVAGVVLGSLPLVVVALEAYSNFLRDWGKAPFELKSLNRQLTTERAKLYNICNQLISDVVPQSDIEPMLQNPFGPLWQSKATKQKIRSRLWDSYEPFEETILEVGEALDSITRRLRVQISQDGQVSWLGSSTMRLLINEIG